MKYQNKLLVIAFFLAIGLVAPLASFGAQLDSAPINGLVGYWGFEEATGTTAFDYSGNQNDGVFYNNPTSVSGKFGKALEFNGLNASVQGRVTYGDQYTVSAWIKPSNLNIIQSYGQTIIAASEDSSYNYPIWILVEGTKLRVYAYQNGTGSFVNSVYNNFQANNWYHITVTAIKGGEVKIYINGAYDSYSTAGLMTTNNYFTIGDLRPNRGIPFTGIIDEVRIYNRVLTATEVSAVYNAGVAKINAQPTIKKTGLDAGLVGYFTMDNQEINWRNNTIIDKSGNGNTGIFTAFSKATSTSVGKLGQALNIRGTDSYISAGASLGNFGVDNFSISGWIKLNAYPNKLTAVLGKWFVQPYFYIRINSDNRLVAVINTTSTNIDTTSNVPLNLSWNHFVYAVDRSGFTKLYINGVLQTDTKDIRSGSQAAISNAGAFSIGRIGNYLTGWELNGNLDDIRVYNRLVAPAEVKQLYAQGNGTKINAAPAVKPLTLDSGLVGYWTMNNQDINWRNLTMTDKSGNGKNGTLVGLGTTTAPAVGKIGQALKFNFSTTSYIALPLIHPNTVTYAAWIKTSSYTVQAIMGTNYGNAQIYWHGGINVGSLGKIVMDIGYPLSTYQTITGTKIVSDNKWHYVVMTSDANGSYLYVDGIQDGYSIYNVGQVPGELESNTTIGAKPIINADTVYSRPFTGLIDEARIYNRALSVTEIKQLYNQGK